MGVFMVALPTAVVSTGVHGNTDHVMYSGGVVVPIYKVQLS